MSPEQFTPYYQLRNEIDTLTNKLEKTHQKHITCKQGCASCCLNFSVFPIEYYAIKEELNDLSSITKNHDDSSCFFLKDMNCQIYPSRPIICRTHGLPLVFMNEEGTEWILSACELNFQDFDGDFTMDNTYPQDTINSKLYIANQEFLKAANLTQNYNDQELIPLKDLFK